MIVTHSKMQAAAIAAMKNAYAPYSKFSVGVCLLADNSQYYVGCNVENASYGLTRCAEVGAVSAMVVDGIQKIKEVVIVSSGVGFCSPCGACRQLLCEFADLETKIRLFNKAGEQRQFTMLELLPYPFKLSK